MLPASTPVPSELHHARFVAVPLTAEVADLDYRAYTSSPDVIRVHSDGRWPVDDFDFATELVQVEEHWSDHQAHRAFAFALLSPAGDRSVGCLYLNPLRDYLMRSGASSQLLDGIPVASAMVTFWLRQDEQDSGLASAVVGAVADWLRLAWPFETYLFRVLPDETSSCAALDGSTLRRTSLPLPGETRPYRWYRPG